MTADDLRAFEEDIANEFNAGRIRAPVHLYSGNEEIMIEIFRHVKPKDWICCSWRSHYQCLLKGVPPDELKAEIMAGHSISLCFPKQRIISSAIVGGILPIAVDLGMAIKRDGGDETVWVFMGDMTAETGIAHECEKYAINWGLPLRFIIEDNRKSVCTDTRSAWNSNGPSARRFNDLVYEYETRWPHAGAGKRVQF
jgi:pyruvate dehydrogenase E1 component alpha subunit